MGTRAIQDEALNQKFMALQSELLNMLKDGVVVAFSGGVDSSFLLWAIHQAVQNNHQYLNKFVALTTFSASTPEHDYKDAVDFAKQLQVKHVLLQSDELSQGDYVKNDQNRCYYCKSELFNISKTLLKEYKFEHIVYGYNKSDEMENRKGHIAAQENNVKSPLADALLTKDDIRFIMKLNNLSLAEKPSSPCLSSRVMTFIPITPPKISRHSVH